MEIQAFQDVLNLMKSEHNKRVGAFEILKDKKKVEEEKLLKIEEGRKLLELEYRMFKLTAEKSRELASQLFCSIATHGLQKIIGDGLKLVPQIYESGGTPCLDVIVKTDYGEYQTEGDPTEDDGGGVADIVALCALSALSYAAENGNTAPWFLDEPTKYLSKGFSEEASRLIKEFSLEFNRQIIMVTHDPTSINYADKAYKFKLDNQGRTQYEDVSVDVVDE